MPVKMTHADEAQWPAHLPRIKVGRESARSARLRAKRAEEREGREQLRQALARSPIVPIRQWRCELTAEDVRLGRERERDLIELAMIAARRRQ